MLTWHFINSSDYDIMIDSFKTSDKLFFIKDDKSILNGMDIFNEDIILYNRNPTTIISGKVYININTLEGIVCAGNRWDTVISPVIVNRTDYMNSDDIKSIAYDSTYNHLVVTKIDDTEDTIEISDLTLDMSYSNGKITFINEDCHLSYGRKIVLSDFVASTIYDSDSKELVITFKTNNTSLVIPVGSILDYDGDIDFTVTGNSFIAECLEYYNAEYSNEVVYENNIYTIHRIDTGISTDVVRSTISMMAEYMATIVDTSLDIMTTVGFDKADQILIADIEGNAKASGVKVTKKVSEYPSNKLVATEKAIAEYMDDNVVVKHDITTYEEFKKLRPDTATDRKLASERTLFEQMSWNII